MFYDFNYDSGAELEGLIIRPEKSEDPDVLNNYSKILKVRNPKIRFTELARMGKFNDYSDQDYSLMLNSIKELNRLFFKDRISVNVFQLLADMTEYILGNYCFSPRQKEDSNDDGNNKDACRSPWD